MARAFERRDTSLGHLLEALRSVIEARTARVRRRFSQRGYVAQDVEDLSQDVLAYLLVDEGRTLRSWDPSRGLSLANFVGLVAERRAYSALLRGQGIAAREMPTDPEALVALAPATDPERAIEARERLNHACERLAADLSRKGATLFRLALLDGLDVNEICSWTGMTPAAVYAWRSRLRRRLRQLDSSPASGTEAGEEDRLVA